MEERVVLGTRIGTTLSTVITALRIIANDTFVDVLRRLGGGLREHASTQLHQRGWRLIAEDDLGAAWIPVRDAEDGPVVVGVYIVVLPHREASPEGVESLVSINLHHIDTDEAVGSQNFEICAEVLHDEPAEEVGSGDAAVRQVVDLRNCLLNSLVTTRQLSLTPTFSSLMSSSTSHGSHVPPGTQQASG